MYVPTDGADNFCNYRFFGPQIVAFTAPWVRTRSPVAGLADEGR